MQAWRILVLSASDVLFQTFSEVTFSPFVTMPRFYDVMLSFLPLT